MIAASWQGWPWVYVIGVVVVLIALWRDAGRAARFGPVVLAVALAAAVAVPYAVARSGYAGEAMWSEPTGVREFFQTGGLLFNPHEPEIVVAADGTNLALVDPTTGESLRDGGHISALSPELGAVVTAGEHAFWFRWDEDGADYDSPAAMSFPGGDDVRAVQALTDDAVVLSRCPQETDEGCVVAGFDAGGAELWRLEGQTVPTAASPSEQVSTMVYPPDDEDEPPTVVVTGRDPLTIRDAASGEAIGALPGSTGVLAGDLLVSTRADGQSCLLTAARGADVLWETSVLTNACDTPTLGDDAVFFQSDATFVTVDLDTGQDHTQRAGQWRTSDIVGSTAVVVDGSALVGLDVRTAEELWRWQPRGAGVDYDIGAGQVLVVSRPATWNPFVTAEVREDGFSVAVLNAETGATVTRIVTADTVDSSQLVDGGLAVIEDDTLTVYGNPSDPRP